VHGADVAVGQWGTDRAIVTCCPAGVRTSPFSAASTAGQHVVRQAGQVRQGLVPDLAAGAVGAAQVPGLVLAAPACLPACELLILATCIAAGCPVIMRS
jgi:hypothetical protein